MEKLYSLKGVVAYLESIKNEQNAIEVANLLSMIEVPASNGEAIERHFLMSYFNKECMEDIVGCKASVGELTFAYNKTLPAGTPFRSLPGWHKRGVYLESAGFEDNKEMLVVAKFDRQEWNDEYAKRHEQNVKTAEKAKIKRAQAKAEKAAK